MGTEELRNLITTVNLGAFPSPSFHETIGLKEQTRLLFSTRETI